MSKKEKAEDVDLIIDTLDNYLDKTNVFYLNQKRFQYLRFLQDNIFASATIVNTYVDDLTSLNMVRVWQKLREGAQLEIVVDQPLSVMQQYDINVIESYLKLAGFEDIVISNTTYEKMKIKFKTLSITCTKPIKNKDAPNAKSNKKKNSRN